jgi:hypothetical protein
MAAVSAPTPKLDRYIVVHVATTCDEHGVYVTKDSAEVIELGWILLDTKTCEEVRRDSSCINRDPSFSVLLSGGPGRNPTDQHAAVLFFICR